MAQLYHQKVSIRVVVPGALRARQWLDEKVKNLPERSVLYATLSSRNFYCEKNSQKKVFFAAKPVSRTTSLTLFNNKARVLKCKRLMPSDNVDMDLSLHFSRSFQAGEITTFRQKCKIVFPKKFQVWNFDKFPDNGQTLKNSAQISWSFSYKIR